MTSTLLGYRRIAKGLDPPYDHAAYTSTHKRAPKNPPIRIAHTLSEITGPRFGAEMVGAGDADLTHFAGCLLYTSPSPRDLSTSRMPSSA